MAWRIGDRVEMFDWRTRTWYPTRIAGTHRNVVVVQDPAYHGINRMAHTVRVLPHHVRPITPSSAEHETCAERQVGAA